MLESVLGYHTPAQLHLSFFLLPVRKFIPHPMATKRALDAIKRIRKNVENEAVAAGNRRWADAPNYSNAVNKYLEAKLPDGRGIKELGQNWNKLRADFPHSRGFIDTVQRFYEDRESSIAALPIGFTPAVHSAILAKARDVVCVWFL